MSEDEEEVDETAAARLSAALEPEPVGRAALGQALILFEEVLALPFPPIPETLATEVRILGAGFIGTLADPPDLSSPEAFLADVAKGPGELLVTGCGSSGLGSRSFVYALLLGPAALYLNLRAGSALADASFARARIEEALNACATLVETVTAPGRPSRLPTGERLIAILTPDDRRLGRLTPDGSVTLEESDDPLGELLAILGEEPQEALQLARHGWPNWA